MGPKKRTNIDASDVDDLLSQSPPVVATARKTYTGKVSALDSTSLKADMLLQNSSFADRFANANTRVNINTLTPPMRRPLTQTRSEGMRPSTVSAPWDDDIFDLPRSPPLDTTNADIAANAEYLKTCGMIPLPRGRLPFEPKSAVRHTFTENPESQNVLLALTIHHNPFRYPAKWDGLVFSYAWWCVKNVVPRTLYATAAAVRTKVGQLLSTVDPEHNLPEKTAHLVAIAHKLRDQADADTKLRNNLRKVAAIFQI